VRRALVGGVGKKKTRSVGKLQKLKKCRQKRRQGKNKVLEGGKYRARKPCLKEGAGGHYKESNHVHELPVSKNI